MSGFAAVWRGDGPPVERNELAPLALALARRGPDASERWTVGAFGVVSTQLETGGDRLRARVASAGELIVAGHLRLDDRDQLLRALICAGARVKAGDADVALFAHGWMLWGSALLDRVRGDFSLVIRDARDRSLTAVRDQFGVRPLFFARSRERVVVSNTLVAVLAAPGISRALHADAIADFLAVGLNEDLRRTTFRDVERLPPGHWARFTATETRVERYWSLPAPAERRLAHSADYAAEFRECLANAVRDRLRGTRVTVMMSGGLDSPSIAALAAREVRERRASTELSLVTSRSLPGIAEADFARAELMASHLSLPQDVVDAASTSYMPAQDAPAFQRPEPYDGPDIALWHGVLAACARRAPVVLFGEDPDTLLAPPDLTVMLRSLPLGRLLGDVAGLLREGKRPHLGMRASARRALHMTAASACAPSWLHASLRQRRLERMNALQPVSHPTRPHTARALASPLWQSLLESLDAGTHGLCLEARLPFLDLRVVELALSVPPIPWTHHKRLLREAMRGLLPDAVRLAPKQAMVGYAEARIARWWAGAPAAFNPSMALADFVDIAALPQVTPASSAEEMTLHFRLRLLDRWLRQQSAT